MELGRSLSEILDECIDRVARGESVDACLADYPEYAIDLREELEAAVLFRGAFDFQPSADAKRAARLRMHEALDGKQRKRFRMRMALPRSWFATGSRIAASTAVAVVALVASGTGTVLAAQNSTPGDLLYSVKRTGEEVQLAFAFSDSREADLRDSLVERRMEELDQVTAAGREQFVAGLVDEIIEHSTRAQELAVAPVKDIVATLPEIDALPTWEPAGTGTIVRVPEGTPGPTPTVRPVGRADKQVSVTPVLTLVGELDKIDDRVKAIEAESLEEHTRDDLARLRKSLNETKQQLNRLMNRADQVHNPDVVERRADRDEQSPDDDIAPTPTLADPLVVDVDGRTTGTIQDVVFQTEKGKLTRVDVLLTLDGDGSRLLVQITQGGTRLLKNGKGASVRALRPNQRVVLSVEDRTGEVLAMSILDTPQRDTSDDTDRRSPKSRQADDHVESEDDEIASSREKTAQVRRSK